MVRYISHDEAISIDEELLNEYKFSPDQLMELAGQSCAVAIHKCYPDKKKILVCCGPGDNGGDGLATARHLKHFGYDPAIYYPKRTKRKLYANLAYQCVSMKINFITNVPDVDEMNEGFDIVVDAMYGSNCKPAISQEFIEVINNMEHTDTPVCSVDIPTGWGVESGCPKQGGIQPDLLISLTAPKKCAQFFNGRYHFLGGRCVPPDLERKYDLQLHEYHGSECCVQLK